MVLARKGMKAVYNGNDKESITVLFTTNPAGEMPPPMILFWYTRMSQAITRKIPDSWVVDNTQTEWMTSELFFTYVTEYLVLCAHEKNIEFLIILYVDGHSSHVTYPLVQLCKQNHVILMSLYPNATNVLQPLDVSFFHPLTNAWKEEIEEFKRTIGFRHFRRKILHLSSKKHWTISMFER